MKDITQRIANLSPAKRALLEQQLKKKGLQTKLENTISRRINSQDTPLSFSQQRMWLVDQLEPGNPAYNRPTNISLKGKLNVLALEQSLNEIIRRHEILRTSFSEVDGQPFQKIAPSITLQVTVVDLSNLHDKETELQQLATKEAQQRFDLTQAPLLKAILVRLQEQEHILLLTTHHIIFDGWSMGVLLKELALLYEAFSTRKPSPLTELPIQYADFADWQIRRQQQTEQIKSQLSYWKNQLGGKLPILELPTDRPRAAVQTFQGGSHSLLLPPQLSASLKALSLKENVTLFMTLLAAFKVLLYRYTGEEDIIVGTPIAGRDRIEAEKLIGVFINTLILRNQLNGNLTFTELLAQVREVALGAYANKDVSFEKLMEELQPDRNLSYTPLFQVLFQLRNLPEETIEVRGLKFDSYYLETGLAMLDLTLEIEERVEGLLCVFKYNTDLFDTATIERMAINFQNLLAGIVENSQLPISQLPLLSKTQQLNCVLIGQESFLIPCAEKLLQRGHIITAIISTGQVINDWAKIREIPCTSSNLNLVDFLSQLSFDYLFSISNLKILSAEVLKLPHKGAINLHDALLPKYGGLYAPSWAILNQETVHGLTWHWMTPGIDEGDIIKQIKLPILESETAFTLNMKCYYAALESFPQVVDALAFDQVKAQTQNQEQSLYFNAVQRPTPGCIINWNWTAKNIDALIRSLDFSSYKNPFGLPKLYIQENFYLITQLEISKQVSEASPGTIVKLESNYLQISTASQDVILPSLQTLEGQDLSLKDWAVEFNLQVGDCLESLPMEDVKQIEDIEVNCLRREAFWVKQLSQMEAIDLPIRKNSQTVLSSSSKQKQLWEVPQVVQNFLSQTTNDWSTQEFLLTAFIVYLARISQNTSFSIGLGNSITFLEKSKLNQLFAGFVPCHLEIDLEQTFANIFVLIKQQINKAKKSKTFHRDVVTRYPELTSLQYLPIEQHLPVTVQFTQTLADYTISTNQKFVLVIARDGDCACFYDENCYTNIAIEKLLASLTTFVEQLVSKSDSQLTNLSLISSQDWVNLEQWNNSSIPYQKNQLVHQLFETQVELTPNAIAVQDTQQNQTLTYNQLNQRANQLARHLQSLGVGPDVLVGICVERSVEMIISILAILKAGGAYVPLDPHYPIERLTLMMTDAEISVLLTQERWINTLPEGETQIFCLDRDWYMVTDRDDQNPISQNTPENLAYIIYTSGSTGKPKGVMIQHGSLVNFTQASVNNYSLRKCDRVLQFASISFDAAAEEIYPSLVSGGRLVLRTYEMLSSVTSFLKNCRDWQLTILDLPTAYWQLIAIELEAGTVTLPESLRLIIIGGERVSPQHVKIWQTYVGDYPQLINTYGPTEGTVVATTFPIAANSNILHEVPIGKPIANLQTYVLDQNLQPLPIGVPGELYIGGDGLARGYLNRQELTREKFIQNPFPNSPSERLYKTGDLVRYLPDGNIEFLGRIDNQVKIRGFRIELGEIESVLNAHPQINQAVVIAREDIPGDKRLVAYLVKSKSLNNKQLRELIKKQLPEYMVPSAFVTLDRFALTPNGKIDLKGLPAPDEILLVGEYVAPRTQSEEIIANIFAKVLKVKNIGIHDNFFELGGHSLLATQLISRLRETFLLEIPLRIVFESPTVAQLHETLTKLSQKSKGLSLTPIQAREKNIEQIPLSWAQERLWFLNQLEGSNATYNISKAFRISGLLDINILQKTFLEILRRHEVLRTSFKTINGVPIQLINPEATININVENLENIASEKRENYLNQKIHQEAITPFDLEIAPLIKCSLLQIEKTDCILLITIHHIVSDGWSMGIFIKEISSLYKAFCLGESSPLPELSIQYSDYAVWQRKYLTGQTLNKQLNYWKQQLNHAPKLLQLPIDRPRPNVQTYRGTSQSFTLNSNLTRELQTLSRDSGVTLFMTIYAAFATLLYSYSGQSDILIGSPIANRNYSEIESLIGFFVNNLVLRTSFIDNPSFEELLVRVRETTLQAYEHQDAPFEKVVEALKPQRSLAYSPLFQVMFVLQNTPNTQFELPNITLNQINIENTISKFDLTLSITEKEGKLIGLWIYNTDLFDYSTIEKMTSHFDNLLSAIVENPQQKVDKLTSLTELEQNQLLLEFTVTERLNIQKSNKFIPPSNPTEDKLASIWSDILHVSKIGINDNFFELGGHSLLATQVISRTRKIFSVEISLKFFFEQPTIAGLSEHIQTLLWLTKNQEENTTNTQNEMEVFEF